MKKALSILIVFVLLIGAVIISVPATAATSTRLGDLNNDGYVTADDARLCLRFVVGLEDLDYESQLAADLGEKGFVSAEDAREILRFSVGFEVEHIKHYMAAGLDKKEALKRAAKDRGVGKSVLYPFSLDL